MHTGGIQTEAIMTRLIVRRNINSMIIIRSHFLAGLTILLFTLLFPLHAMAQDPANSEASQLPAKSDGKKSVPPVKTIPSANKLVLNTIMTWKPIFETCVPENYNAPVSFTMTYDAEGKIWVSYSGIDSDISACLKNNLPDKFNIDVRKNVMDLDLCHFERGTVVVEYKDQSLSYKSHTYVYNGKQVETLIGSKKAGCSCNKKVGCCYGVDTYDVMPFLTYKQKDQAKESGKDCNIAKCYDKGWSVPSCNYCNNCSSPF